jgi:hypothetical protein
MTVEPYARELAFSPVTVKLREAHFQESRGPGTGMEEP